MEVCYSFLFQSLTSLENINSESNFSVFVYRFKVKLVKSHFDDFAYVDVNSIFYSKTLILISICVRFLANIYSFISWLNLVHLELLEGFYYFTLIANLHFFSLTTNFTILRFLILHGLVSYLIIFHMILKHVAYLIIYHIVIIEYLILLHVW